MRQHIFFGLCLAFVVTLSLYNLTESPPTWMDEGVITQVARNMALNNEHAIQTAPGEFLSGSYITTGYPVTFPIYISFLLFGIGILQARVIMAIFIILLFSALYILLQKNEGTRDSKWFLYITLLLVASFAPLYGQGKNVLGEVPGLCYLILSFIFLQKMYTGVYKNYQAILAGLFLGLAIVTKPIYLLIALATVITFFLYREKLFSDQKKISLCIIFLVLPILVWLMIQFQGDTLANVTSLYSNPNAEPFGNVLLSNLTRFFTEAQPLYTLLLFLAWTITGTIRWTRRKLIKPVEVLAWIFSGLILLAYLRTAGFYRYFFPAEILSLIFFVDSVKEVIAEKYHRSFLVCLALLVCFQLHQTFFNSWISVHNEGYRSARLSEHIGKIDPSYSIFFYQVPEAVNFLNPNHKNYYQYIKISSALALGEEFRKELTKGTTDLIITTSDSAENPLLSPLFSKYHKKESFDRYVILSK